MDTIAVNNAYWRSHGAQLLDYPQPGFERAAQLYQLAARVEVRIVVANTAAYLRSNLMSQLEHIERQAEVQWSTQQLTLLNETSHAFERALDNQTQILESDSVAEIARTSQAENPHTEEIHQIQNLRLTEAQNLRSERNRANKRGAASDAVVIEPNLFKQPPLLNSNHVEDKKITDVEKCTVFAGFVGKGDIDLLRSQHLQSTPEMDSASEKIIKLEGQLVVMQERSSSFRANLFLVASRSRSSYHKVNSKFW